MGTGFEIYCCLLFAGGYDIYYESEREREDGKKKRKNREKKREQQHKQRSCHSMLRKEGRKRKR